MSEATRKFAAIVCAELAGKVDVNDFRNVVKSGSPAGVIETSELMRRADMIC